MLASSNPRFSFPPQSKTTPRAISDWLLFCTSSFRRLSAQPLNLPQSDRKPLLELIQLVQERSAGKVATPAGRLLVSASTSGGGSIPTDNMAAAADFLLVHGNGVGEPDRIRQIVEECRRLPGYRGQPILFNEDDHFEFEADDNNMLAAISRYASWGCFDHRLSGEGYDEGYQSVPVNWGISSARKRGFFDLVANVTGSTPTCSG